MYIPVECVYFASRLGALLNFKSCYGGHSPVWLRTPTGRPTLHQERWQHHQCQEGTYRLRYLPCTMKTHKWKSQEEPAVWMWETDACYTVQNSHEPIQYGFNGGHLHLPGLWGAFHNGVLICTQSQDPTLNLELAIIGTLTVSLNRWIWSENINVLYTDLHWNSGQNTNSFFNCRYL